MSARDVPMVAPLEPRDDGIVVVIFYQCIGKNRMPCTFADGLLNGRSHGKVHVSYPHRDNIFSGKTAEHAGDGGAFIPFHTTGASSVDNIVKVILHGDFVLPCDKIARYTISLFR